MAVTTSHLTDGEGGTGFTSVATASITPTANSLVLVAVNSKKAAGNTPTVTGCSMTWVQIATINQTTDQTTRTTLFRGMSASPSSGALTIDFAGQAQDRAAWGVTKFSGVDITGTNGSGAIVQSATNASAVTSNTVTLSAFGSANNATYGVISSLNQAFTVGSGFTEIFSRNSAETTIEAEFKSTNDTSVDWTYATYFTAAVAVEIAAAPSTTGAAFLTNFL